MPPMPENSVALGHAREIIPFGGFECPKLIGREEPTCARSSPDEIRNGTRYIPDGYEMETLSPGLPFTATFLDPGIWAREFIAALDMYENTAGMWLVGEDMPQAQNRATLNTDVRYQWG